MAKRNAFSMMAIPLVALLLLSFQNCGPSFQTIKNNSEGLADLSVGTEVPLKMSDATSGIEIDDTDEMIVDVEYRVNIEGTRIPAGAVVLWTATAAPGGGAVHTHPGADQTQIAFHCEAAGIIYLNAKIESSGVTYASEEITKTCVPVPPPAATPAPGAMMLTFRIPAGTGTGPWNTSATVVRAKLGQTVRIFNDDLRVHRLHTGGAPCGHQGNDTQPGGSFDCVITRAVNSAAGSTYDHNIGTGARFYIDATP